MRNSACVLYVILILIIAFMIICTVACFIVETINCLREARLSCFEPVQDHPLTVRNS